MWYVTVLSLGPHFHQDIELYLVVTPRLKTSQYVVRGVDARKFFIVGKPSPKFMKLLAPEMIYVLS